MTGSGHERDARGFVAGLGLEPGPGDRRVLVVRRLVVPAEDPAVARRRISDLWDEAAEPARGPVDERAAAVRFRDEAEALACLSADVVAGSASAHWWWKRRLPRYTTTVADTLAVLWLAEPRWVPAAVAHLHQLSPRRTVATLAALPEVVARVLLAAVVAEHLPGLALPPRQGGNDLEDRPATVAGASLVDPTGAQTAGRDAPPTVTRSSPGSGRPGPEPAPRRWLSSAEVLLEVAVVLEERAPLARTAEFAAWLAAPIGPLSAAGAVASQAGPADGLAAGPVARDGSVPADEPRPTLRLVPVREGEPPVEADPAGAWRHRPWEASGPAVPTELASLLYAVNLIDRFDLGRLAEASTGWAVVEALGRLLLRGLPSGRRRVLLADPLFPLLAELDTRPSEVRNPVRLGAAFRPVRDFLAEHRLGVATFTRPGSVLVSRTHVDVVLGLDQIDLDARAVGLDRDPGWVPDLGRIVLFHFDEGAP